MKKFFVIYRSGGTHNLKLTAEDEDEISKNWNEWVTSLGDSFIENSPVIRGGVVINTNGEVELEVNDDMVNGYIKIQADEINDVVEMCKKCPLHKVGKTFEVRELPQH